MKKAILVISLILICGSAFSAPVKLVTGTVNKVQLMGQNYTSYTTSGEAIVFIHMDALPLSCENTNGYRRVAITSDHPAFDVVVSTALSAKVSGATVDMFYLEECTLWFSNAWDFAIINLK